MYDMNRLFSAVAHIPAADCDDGELLPAKQWPQCTCSGRVLPSFSGHSLGKVGCYIRKIPEGYIALPSVALLEGSGRNFSGSSPTAVIHLLWYLPG